MLKVILIIMTLFMVTDAHVMSVADEPSFSSAQHDSGSHHDCHHESHDFSQQHNDGHNGDSCSNLHGHCSLMAPQLVIQPTQIPNQSLVTVMSAGLVISATSKIFHPPRSKFTS